MTFVVLRASLIVTAVLLPACGIATDAPAPAAVAAPAPAPAAPASTAREPIGEATPEPPLSAAALAAVKAPAKGDLDAMAARGRIRVLVSPSRTYYAVDNNLQRGATYDAGVAFARFAGARLGAGQPSLAVVFIPTPEDKLVSELLAGRGDLAANLRQTFERDEQVAFATPTMTGIRELVVTGPGQRPIVSLEDVAGRFIHVRKGSDHHASLLRLNEQLKKIDRAPARIALSDEALTDEDLLDRVNEGTFPATLADDYVFEARQRELTSVAANKDVAVSQDGVIAWVTRKDAPQLLAAINAFFAAHKPRP